MTFIYPTSKLDYAGKTLIIPIVSTANVSQLAVDLIITTLSLQQIAIVDPSYFIPVVGGREDGQPGITTPLELYGKPGSNIIAFQQRSPVLKTQKDEFVTALLQFIKTSEFASVLFLSGVDLSERTDSQMFTPTYHLLPKNTLSLENSPLSNLSSLPIPAYTTPVHQFPHLQPEIQRQENKESPIPFIPGGGLTRRILSSIPSENWTIPTAAILQFVMEGDNRADANLLAAVVAKLLNFDSQITEWRQPQSWKEGLFGTPQDQTLYG